MNEQFQKTIKDKDIDVYDLHKYFGLNIDTTDITDHDIAAIITYRVEIDARPYGIKDINITIEDIRIAGIITIDKESLTEHELELIKKVYICTEYSNEVDVDLEVNIDKDWKIYDELSIERNYGVPQNIEIELTAKRINVS